MHLTAIPGGTVMLRDSRRNTERRVVLQPFRIATTPVRAGEFVFDLENASSLENVEAPASGVRWLDAVAWCNAASEAEGIEPAYTFTDEAVRWNPAANGFRLPTEAEWVFASLGGGLGPRYGPLSEIAWSALDDVGAPQTVGRKAPNDYGLFDTLGNVWEWCWDRLDPARYGEYRLLKGGGWADPEWSCRVGVRRGNAPDAIVEDVGFRAARGAVADSAGADGGQGWSEAADRQRAAASHPLPLGWTPLR
ncbi:formylglycine-generating enzyme family protein [Pseudoclavibacter endophyticus]|nr:SUMF1/EgtB/PvdO family nonheme iron enzyme [Pseudoclavibacter endophyticus]